MCMDMNIKSGQAFYFFPPQSLSFLVYHPLLCSWFFPSCSYRPFRFFFHHFFRLIPSLQLFYILSFQIPYSISLFPFSLSYFFSFPDFLESPIICAWFTPCSCSPHMIIMTLILNVSLTSHLFITFRLPISSCYRQTMLLLAAHIRKKGTLQLAGFS